MTPHIKAKKEEIAPVVLMPGDPLRAKYIAESFLDNYKLVNEVRNMFMYTGEYKGKRITIAGSGMGCPSIGIYSYELFKFYDVETIIRIGSAGSYDPNVKIYDLVNASKVYGENSYAKIVADIDEQVITAPGKIYEVINETAQEINQPVVTGTIHSSDVFYRKHPDDWKKIHDQYQAICVEMESFALFANAIALKKNAACLLTISDSLVIGESTSPEERQTNFVKMMKLALESAIKL